MSTTPNNPETRPTRAELAALLTGELIQLRDALVSLSICLKDWQFELDQNGNRVSQKMADQALEKFRLPRSSGADHNSTTKSSWSEGS
jgi:hypothetical protein